MVVDVYAYQSSKEFHAAEEKTAQFFVSQKAPVDGFGVFELRSVGQAAFFF